MTTPNADSVFVSDVCWEDGERCPARTLTGPTFASIPCDLVTGHDGPHFYICDVGDEGEPNRIAIWRQIDGSTADDA